MRRNREKGQRRRISQPSYHAHPHSNQHHSHQQRAHHQAGHSHPQFSPVSFPVTDTEPNYHHHPNYRLQKKI